MKTIKCMLAALAVSVLAAPAFAADEDLFERAPWFTTLGLNWYETEGDWEMEPGVGVFGKVGYSLNAWWDVEAGLNLMPSLSARDADELNVEPLEDSTSALRLSLEALLHLRASGTTWRTARPSWACSGARDCSTTSTIRGRCAPMWGWACRGRTARRPPSSSLA